MILRIANTPRPYAWGSTTAIAELLGTEPSGGPEAELWLGAHPGSPARILQGAPEADLAEWVRAHRADGRLPFLLKVLAASEPLSLQAHPTITQAIEGFARESAAGIPVDAPERNYRDEGHKPEVVFALSDPFIALAGFRSVAESAAQVRVAASPALEGFLSRLTGDAALADVVPWLMAGGADITTIVDALTEAALHLENGEHDSESWASVRRLARYYPGDPGVAISMLMHTVVLRAGEALYLPTGNIHSYQEGLAIEVMAASDNVLRGGLTPKHVDVPELMSVLDVRPLPAPYLTPLEREPGVREYRPDVPDFVLTVVDDDGLRRGCKVDSAGAAIVLCLEGEVLVQGAHRLERGQSVFCSDDILTLSGRGRLVVATGSRELL